MEHQAAIRAFMEIADHGSLTQAAETLDLSRAMVSRHLEGLAGAGIAMPPTSASARNSRGGAGASVARP